MTENDPFKPSLKMSSFVTFFTTKQCSHILCLAFYAFNMVLTLLVFGLL